MGTTSLQEPGLVRTNSIFESRKVWSSAAGSELAQAWEGSKKFCSCSCGVPAASSWAWSADSTAPGSEAALLFLILWATGSAGDTGTGMRWAQPLFSPYKGTGFPAAVCIYSATCWDFPVFLIAKGWVLLKFSLFLSLYHFSSRIAVKLFYFHVGIKVTVASAVAYDMLTHTHTHQIGHFPLL